MTCSRAADSFQYFSSKLLCLCPEHIKISHFYSLVIRLIIPLLLIISSIFILPVSAYRSFPIISRHNGFFASGVFLFSVTCEQRTEIYRNVRKKAELFERSELSKV